VWTHDNPVFLYCAALNHDPVPRRERGFPANLISSVYLRSFVKKSQTEPLLRFPRLLMAVGSRQGSPLLLTLTMYRLSFSHSSTQFPPLPALFLERARVRFAADPGGQA
jgi:hypothetical protein